MKLNAMSPIGYTIVIIILIGFGMIISAPMIISKKEPTEVTQYNNDSDYEISNIEKRLNDRIDSIQKLTSDKYICSIEGGVDDNKNVVPIDSNKMPNKFVFVCEYNK